MKFQLFCLLVATIVDGMALAQGSEVASPELPLASNDVSKASDNFHVLIYDTNDSLEKEESAFAALFDQKSRALGIPTTVFGAGSKFLGFGSKYVSVVPLLQDMNPDTPVVVSDARDVILNVPNKEKAPGMLEAFKGAFHS